MKISIKLSLILFLIVSSFSFGQINVVSEVKEATVFSNQAQLTREQTVRLEKGTNKLKFIGMENSIVSPTIQVSGTGGITVLSTSVNSENLEKSMQPAQIISILDEIEELNKKEDLTKKQAQNLEHEKNAILYNKSANGTNSGFNLDNMLDLVEFYRNNLNKLDSLIYVKNKLVSHFREERGELRNELGKLGYKTRGNVMNIEVISEKSQTVSIKLEYVVQNIGWTPFYEIKTQGIGDKVTAICKAKIYQNSSIDWKNVALTLSTTSPSNVGVLPTVHPWVLRFQNQRRDKFKGFAVSQSNTAYSPAAEMDVSANGSYDSKSMASYTSATESMVSREFAIYVPYSISGRNGKAAVDIEEFVMDANYLYYSAPKYNCNVFLIANIQEWEKYNFLPGSANLFLEGTFVGTTFINPNATEDTMSLILGIDKSIVIEREKIKDFSRNAMLGGKKKVDMGIQITVKNKKSLDIDLMLEDQVPISSDENIEINIKEISGAKREEDTGKLTWRESIPKGETKVYKIKYEVKYPKSKPLSNF